MMYNGNGYSQTGIGLRMMEPGETREASSQDGS